MPEYTDNPYAGFGTYEDYLRSLGENPLAYGEPQEPIQPEQPQVEPPLYDNPYWGPLNTPGEVTIGDPTYQLPGSDMSVIGSVDANGVNNYDFGQNDPASSHGSLGPNNPTIYGAGGGLWGSGIDIGIPGVASVGGIGTTLGLGALLGMNSPGMGLGGAVGVDTGGSGGMLGLGAGGGLLGLGGALSPRTGPSSNPVSGPQQYPAQTINGDTPLTNPATVLPAGSGIGSAQQPQQPTTLVPPITNTPPVNNNPGVINGDTPTTPTTVLPPVTGIGGNGVTPQTNTPTTIPIPVISGNAPTNTPVQPQNPTTIPVVPAVTPGPTGPTGPTSGPVTLPIPTPTPTTMPNLPIDRNYYREGNQTNQDLGSLLGGIFSNYAGQSGQYGGADLSNFNSLLGGVLGNNGQLTSAANQQTAAGNTALRGGNVADAQQFGPQALSLLQQLNPNMYSSLNQANTTAGAAGQPSDIQMTLEQQARTGLGLGQSLSDEELRNAQQAARTAWGARGLINSNGAIGAEILNRDSLGRARQQERQQFAQGVDASGFAQRQTGLNNQFQNAQLQSQNAFNPFNTITSANTTNQGNNQNLFGQTAGFSSGSFGNQNVNQLVNPFNPYAQDVYSTNYNAANDRLIAAGNNAAGLAAGQSQSNGAMAAAFARALGDYLGRNPICWVAREVFGADDPRWLQFREWLMMHSPTWFLQLYVKHGERFAGWLKRHPWAKPPIRAWMKSRINSMKLYNLIEEVI